MFDSATDQSTRFVPTDVAVLCFLRDDASEKVLLIRKKRGLGAGKIIAPGGKAESGESLVETAVRETTEEVGLTPLNPAHRGTLYFTFADGYLLEVHVYTACRWSGTLTETSEAVPLWTSRDAIPYDQMWADDRLWLPRILDGRSVRGEFHFTGDQMTFWDIRFSHGERLRGTG